MTTLTDPAIQRIIEGASRIDHALPPWARRSNPIVRRHLGIYWKQLPLQLDTTLRLLVFQAVIILLTIPFPPLLDFIMPLVTMSLLLVPVALVLYGLMLLYVANMGARAMYEERGSNTLALLLTTPLPERHILFSKVAAAVWRHMDTLSMAVAVHALLSMPVLVLYYATLYPPQAEDGRAQVAIVLALGGQLGRLLLEPVMAGAIGVLMGAWVKPRTAASLAAMLAVAAYSVFINAARLFPLDWGGRVLVELVLPLALPALLAWGAVSLTGWLLRRD